MRYVKIAKSVASAYGLSEEVRLVSDVDIIINEKELLNENVLNGTFENRVKCLEGVILTNMEVKQLVNKGGYNYGL